jgi:molybdate transport system substrate-binding protein
MIGGSCSSVQSDLVIFAAAGAKTPLDEVCRRFEERYHTQIRINYGGGGEVLSQMILSKDGDVYVAPEQSFMETATTKLVIEPDTIRNVAYMIPVIAVQKGNPLNITSLTDLTRPDVSLVISRTETTLVGQYALDIFAKAGLTEDIEKNVVTQAARPDNILTMLMMGQVDAGIIWHFYQIQASEYMEVIFLPPNQITGIGEMQAAVSTYSNNKSTARDFIDFLVSGDGKSVFKNAGYIINNEEVKQYWQ